MAKLKNIRIGIRRSRATPYCVEAEVEPGVWVMRYSYRSRARAQDLINHGFVYNHQDKDFDYKEKKRVLSEDNTV